MRSLPILNAAAAVAVLTLSGITSNAATITATFNTITPADSLTMTLRNTYFTSPTTETVSFAVGQFNWTGVSSNPTGLTGAFPTFCIDFDQHIGYGSTYNFTLTSIANASVPNGPNQGNPYGGLAASNGLGTSRTRETLIRQLWAQFYPTLGTSSDKFAAFQLTLWKILYENTPSAYTSITAGDFKLSGSTTAGNYATLANGYLAFLTDPNNAAAAQDQSLYAMTSPTAQDQLVSVPNPGNGAQIPEPAQAGLIGTGALLLLKRRRRA